VGLKGITREGMDYELTLLLELDMRHYAKVSKDRTSLFVDQPDFVITADNGKQLLYWCNTGISQQQVESLIQQAIDIPALVALYETYPEFRQELMPQFIQRKT
jgi:hypothetical protein